MEKKSIIQQCKPELKRKAMASFVLGLISCLLTITIFPSLFFKIITTLFPSLYSKDTAPLSLIRDAWEKIFKIKSVMELYKFLASNFPIVVLFTSVSGTILGLMALKSPRKTKLAIGLATAGIVLSLIGLGLGMYVFRIIAYLGAL